MTFKGTRHSTLAESALEHLYTLATEGTEDPSDEIELAYVTIEEALDELERLKRYPTADEVCKVLTAHTGYKVIYIEENKEFGYTEEPHEFISEWITEREGQAYAITMFLPPHLITLIGRFYEGLEK
jgi:hypothetical protein